MKAQTLIAALIIAVITSAATIAYAMGAGAFSSDGDGVAEPATAIADQVATNGTLVDAGTEPVGDPVRPQAAQADPAADTTTDAATTTDGGDAADGADQNPDTGYATPDPTATPSYHPEPEHPEPTPTPHHKDCPYGKVYDHHHDTCVEIPKPTPTPQHKDCPYGKVYDPHHDTCVEIPPTVITCEPGLVYDADLEACIPPVSIHCVAPLVYDADLEACVPPVIVDCIPPLLWDADLEACVPGVDIHCLLGYEYDYDAAKCVYVGCPSGYVLSIEGLCEELDVATPLDPCPHGQVRIGLVCVDVQINPDLLPDLDLELLPPVADGDGGGFQIDPSIVEFNPDLVVGTFGG